MSIRIGIITNPHAKLNKRNPLRPKLLGYILGQRGITEITNSLEDLQKVARKFLQHGINLVAINGGDGTISLTISTFIHVYKDHPLPKIALLCGGTMNVIAINLGIKGSPENLLALMLEKASDSEPFETISLPTIKVENRYGFLFADGTSSLILEEFYRNKTDHFGAFLLGVRLVFSTLFNGPLTKKLIKEQQIAFQAHPHPKIYHASLGTYATTLKTMPMNIPMFLNDCPSKHLQAISITCPATSLIRRILKILMSKKVGIDRDRITYFCQKLHITARANEPYTLDGEIFHPAPKELHISLGPTIEFIKI